jgi:hypothetical protein
MDVLSRRSLDAGGRTLRFWICGSSPNGQLRSSSRATETAAQVRTPSAVHVCICDKMHGPSAVPRQRSALAARIELARRIVVHVRTAATTLRENRNIGPTKRSTHQTRRRARSGRLLTDMAARVAQPQPVYVSPIDTDVSTLDLVLRRAVDLPRRGDHEPNPGRMQRPSQARTPQPPRTRLETHLPLSRGQTTTTSFPCSYQTAAPLPTSSASR